MFILGISCFYHDAAAALVQDGVLVACAQEERFTRIKHDASFPEHSIDFCLKFANITSSNLDYVVFYEKPFLKFERILLTNLQMFPKSYRNFKEAMMIWLKDKLWIKNRIKEKFKIRNDKVLFIEHHLSHAASSYFCSPYDECAMLTCDGVGEWATTTTGIAKENKINLTKEIKFPHSLGLLYSAFTAFLGFKINDGEYKVMGMSAYGKPRYINKIYKLIKQFEDASFLLNMKCFSYHWSVDKTFSKYFEELFGKPRNSKNDKIDEYYADLAASIQLVLENVLLNLVRSLHKKTGYKKLCLSGGVALNCLANGRILKESDFEEIYVSPSPGDSGGAIGCAMYVYHTLLNKQKKFIMTHTYYGERFNNSYIKDFLERNSIAYKFEEKEDELVSKIAQYISQGKVVGFFQDRFEFGPRALGARSILADPTRSEMKDIINKKIKFRESFRPFAPSVLMEKADDFFEVENVEKHYPFRFMLYAAKVKEGKEKIIPATTHIDNTARLQVVDENTSPRFYKLIKKFEEIKGVPVVLNTSFNLKDEPIVATPSQAFAVFKKSEIDILVLENFIIEK